MTITLFPDQSETIEKLRQSMRRHKSVLLQSPTGSGKTAMATYMIQSALGKNKRMVFTVPRKELLRQTSDSFESHGINHSFVAAGRSFNPHAKVYIGMIDTMARRLEKIPKADVVFVDEAHYGATALDNVIRHYQGNGSWVIGLSATPWKLSGKGLGCWFDDMVQGLSVRELIDMGRLSDYRAFRGKSPDLSGISVVGGDYAKGQLSDAMTSKANSFVIGDAVRYYKSHAQGKLAIAYCTSVKHAEMTAQSFNASGVPAASIDGRMDDGQRRTIIQAFARREIKVLTNCDLLTFGFDLAMQSGMDVTVEAMFDLRPTKSLALQLQKWGRVLRRKDEPALIFDHACNIMMPDGTPVHGLPCSEQEWTLEDRSQGKRSGTPGPRVLQCSNCFYCFSPAPKCPECGQIVDVNGREIEEIDGELTEIDRAEIEREKKQKRMEVGQAKTVEDLRRIAAERGYKKGWIYQQMKIKKIKS